MPRWPEGHITKRTCPGCGGRKDHYAVTCRKCAPKQTPLLGRKGPDHPAWRGGRLIDRDGYVRLYKPEYEFARAGGYVLEHVMVVEQSIGRRLSPTECVHHVDHDRQHNELSNLEIQEFGAHSRMHRESDKESHQRDSLGRFSAV